MKRPLAFKGSRTLVTTVFATAEDGITQKADSTVARSGIRAVKREITVPLTSVKAGDELEGTVVSYLALNLLNSPRISIPLRIHADGC
jgi:hypothetical protein